MSNLNLPLPPYLASSRAFACVCVRVLSFTSIWCPLGPYHVCVCVCVRERERERERESESERESLQQNE